MAQGRVIVVTGPTASGKSALALALAERRSGTVINADAMQTYDAFPILTAQPSADERARVPHALYGVLPLSETLSAARWRTLASAEIEGCLAAGRTPILCGGSGLYLRTLMQGIATIPDVPQQVREQANADWQALGADAFRTRLAEKDPAIVARLKPGDRQRHVRAWEVASATGRPLSDWQTDAGSPAPWRFATILLAPERDWLRGRIESRFDAMLGQGVLAEVRQVFDRSPDPRWPGLKAHGAPELFRHFRGELPLEKARQIAIDHTRQYAKRQMTWFRHQLTPDLVVDPQSAQALASVAQYLTKTEA
ncbi:MAG: tRNA (adenosine(37)-N6)-dimethylallyltransferase MiaA [Reyranella sp.]|uniref:tRNA (adenosine(37)-N6)-dimethylallyltransferase MiaA n=1 Tax=Reyranella sp. TaxID=1929291 RepID=UPI00122832ED|nr:tRNA (adenosine(37)-N6)-dimethylallyltransferase MiaA [Reyranella sp.]TAJ42086.1 MAG: tRNA (adenosine(37)-N6)-dimethylallyltransferase MiaA [Reyranella sp.]